MPPRVLSKCKQCIFFDSKDDVVMSARATQREKNSNDENEGNEERGERDANRHRMLFCCWFIRRDAFKQLTNQLLLFWLLSIVCPIRNCTFLSVENVAVTVGRLTNQVDRLHYETINTFQLNHWLFSDKILWNARERFLWTKQNENEWNFRKWIIS